MILSSFFEALIRFNFLRYALIAGLFIGVLAPLIGSVVVIKRLSFIADTLSHFSLAGVCFGVFLSKILTINFIPPLVMGIIFSIVGTFIIEKLRSYYNNYKEISMVIVLSAGASLSGIFISLSNGVTSSDTNNLLFGNILTVDIYDLIIIIFLSIIIISFMLIYRHQIISICFDEEYAKISGLNTRLFQLIITMILAVSISLFMDIVGVLLISSLMIIPIATSILIGKSYKNTIIKAIIISEISIISGFILSFYLSLPTGSLIVLISIFILFIMIFYIRKCNIKTAKIK